jgi:hypothetical protein
MKRRSFITNSTRSAAGILFGFISKELNAMAGNGSKRKRKILLRSSWQTVNIGDIAHTPGVLALCQEYLPEVEVILWAGNVGDGVRELLKKRFPSLQIIPGNEKEALQSAFLECDFLLHGSGPYLVAAKDVEDWIRETGKPFGVYSITLPEEHATDYVIRILSQARFVYFRDSVSLNLAKEKGLTAPVMEFGPDGAFAVDLRNDTAAIQFLKSNGLREKEFLCVIPKYRRTPYWEIPSKNVPFNEEFNSRNELMKEHDLKPYREAIISVVRDTPMKILICPEDVTQIALGKKMLYDPLPEDVKLKVVWRDKFWLTDEALSTYIRSAGLFGLEQHSPIMCIGNGIPALVGRFKEQTSKGFMWNDIGLGDWLFDSDSEADMARLIPTVLSLVREPDLAKEKALKARRYVESMHVKNMKVLRKNL